ncbi:MAG: hypothetical protein E7355_02615 [Clostridiales bacterium]|nr:hypothetical protein [Clostridiales bacterium]
MHYVKKMCILRQIKQGFSGDGKTLSGLVKIEQYGKNLAVEVSIINFAPLSSGEYYCLLADSFGKTEMLALRGKSLFNILTDMELEQGFCAVICFVKTDVLPIAYGVNGNASYDWKKILAATIPRAFSKNPPPSLSYAAASAENTDLENGQTYNDERLAKENYYKEQPRGQELFQETIQNAHVESANQKQDEKARADATENADNEDVRHPFTTDTDGYYRSVKTEIDELLHKYPKDDTLRGAFSCSEWVRVKGDEENPQYLVGVIYEDGKARYICYALAAQNGDTPPEEIKDVCAFVPHDVFHGERGFFVIFQSAATGECVKPFRA